MKIIKCLLLSVIMLMFCSGCNSTGQALSWANYNAQQQMYMSQQAAMSALNNLNNNNRTVHYCSRYWCE